MKGIKKTSKNWEWRTHSPILKLITARLSPKLFVELGVGVYSSPIFLNLTDSKIILIDNSKEWLEVVRSNTTRTDNVDFLFHDLGTDVLGSTTYDELDTEKQQNIQHYYSQLAEHVDSIDESIKLLFVDNYTCVRSKAIELLSSKFDIIVYHDAEEECFEYSFDEISTNGYSQYIFKTPRSWTGILIKDNINLDILNIANEYIEEWCNQEKLDSSLMYIEEISYGK